ncbi:hypothetical protein PIB30_011896 [Stylosanthes scabra]|uniref:Disease resistance RPP13-like protein 1 n=1 Tax=Stylosanthes scabra TaxID=79078 RepID=A0ABU6V4W8_9FABA|nr:hypothetical protein [Stylosanthes scabra]
MAEKLYGGAYLSSFVDAVLDNLSKILEDDDSVLIGNYYALELLERLQNCLLDVGPVLDDAELKQFTDKRVKKWLVDLQDALYFADDMLDELFTKAATATATQRDPAGISSHCNSVVDSILEDSREMEDIVRKLEKAVERKTHLPLEKTAKVDMSWRIPSTSLVVSSDIFGRDKDKDEIIKLLLADTCHAQSTFTVIPIWGMGGIGKTTLAQLVYSDAKVVENFDIRVWVCVAENSDPVHITRTIIGAIDPSPCSMDNFDVLQTKLKDKLIGKTFLLVLDDVWHGGQRTWENLLKPFQYGNNGSKILLTTRIEKTLGGLLRNKSDVGDWKKILESEIWELPEDESEIVPALRVSYHYLPSHLKRCFVYCSLFPQDYEFNKDELILLWMAEDLLRPMGNDTLENIGSQYFDELVARSFFQSSSSFAGLFGMHDLMHDLATFFAGKFFSRKFCNPGIVDSKTRHLSCDWDPISRFPEAYDGAIHMRTFLCFGNLKIDLWLKKFRCLRALALRYFEIQLLPDLICEFIYLRYLNLSEKPIVTLPESLCKLYNLQTLKLRDCNMLEMLPSRMQDLVNLRHLDIRGTASLEEMPKGMSKLKHLNLLGKYIVGEHEENGIRELGPIDVHGSFRISKLENVNNSKEALEAKMGIKKHIDILELVWRRLDGNTVNVQAERDILEELRPHSNLKELSIEGYRGEIFPDWLGLSCYSNITKLIMYRCENCRELPWLGQLLSLQHLEIFELHGLERIGEEFCKGGESYHEGTPFRSLEFLGFAGMKGLQEWHIPDEFDGFPKLNSLVIKRCPVLKGDLPAHLPALKLLTIWNCEELACWLPRAPKLHRINVNGSRYGMRVAEPNEVRIEYSQQVQSVLECLRHIQPPCIQSLTIQDCGSAISISGDYLPASLQYLEISYCSKLTFPEPLEHQLLTEIDVRRCDSLTLFPLGGLPNLKKLTISHCPRLVSLPALGFTAPHLEKLEIEKCPEIDYFGEECLPRSLTTLNISNCQKLERWITSNGLHSEGLTHLTLYKWKEVKSFPTEGCLPASLQYLLLDYFPNLETLDCKGLHHLTSLKDFRIESCQKLENITEENLPASMSTLYIYGECPLASKLQEMNDPRIQIRKY